MAKKSEENNSDFPGADGNTSRKHRTSTKKVLSRKEKLEAAKKANQAMMRAWKLISQRKTSDTDAEGDI